MIWLIYRMLDDRKEYFALSMQFKDELRKIIRKYKEYLVF